MTADLVAFLREQLNTEEQEARATDQTMGQRQLHWSVKPVDNAFSKVVAHGMYDVTGEVNPETAAFIARHDPARVLAEITAKRRMIDEVAAAHASAVDMEHACCHEPGQILAGECDQFAPDRLPLLRLLALPYAGVDGYRPEWAPDA
jgi:hypothetical protein